MPKDISIASETWQQDARARRHYDKALALRAKAKREHDVPPHELTREELMAALARSKAQLARRRKNAVGCLMPDAIYTAEGIFRRVGIGPRILAEGRACGALKPGSGRHGMLYLGAEVIAWVFQRRDILAAARQRRREAAATDQPDAASSDQPRFK